MGIWDLLGFGNKSTLAKLRKRIGTVPFQEQLDTFRELGFVLNPGIGVGDINRWGGGLKEFEDQPFHLLYQTLGQTIEREPWTPLTNQCWNFDVEAIEDYGSYVDILHNIARITGGELVFEAIEDYVELEDKKAWVSFTCMGDRYKWDLVVDDDWVDGRLFDKVQDLAVKYGTGRRFTFFNTGGQDLVLGYYTPEELDIIRDKTGLDIVWLKAKGQIY